MSRGRKVWAAGIAAALLVGTVAALLVLRSGWFRDQVRQRIVRAVETATGGKAELGSFAFDWRRMRVEVRGFVLHGTEGQGKPPLLSARSIAAGLKIRSVFKTGIDVEYLDVAGPRVYLIVYPDGRTNIPGPKTAPRPGPPLRDLFKLAAGRFNVAGGLFELEAHGKTTFEAQGRNLEAAFSLEQPGSLYRGSLSVRPLDLRLAGYEPIPVDVVMALTLAPNRIDVTAAKLVSGDSRVELSGALEDLMSTRASFRYDARLSFADAARILRLKSPDRGIVQASGSGRWAGGSDFSLTGAVHASVPEYRDSMVRLRDLRADGALSAGPKGAELAGVRWSLNYWNAKNRVPAEGRIERLTLRGGELDFRGIALAALGGRFNGDVRVRDFDNYSVTGKLEGFDARRAVGVYSAEPLPWNARISGTLNLAGSFRRSRELRAGADLAVSPEPGTVPVNGRITVRYEARGRILDLGHSTLSLPSSRLDFSGAIGRELRVHLESRDLDELLPVLGQNRTSIPVRLENGRAVFDGTVTGRLDDPHIGGRLTANDFSYEGRILDSLRADVTASRENVRIANAAVARGKLRAQFELAVNLVDWKTAPEGAIFGAANISNADVVEVAETLRVCKDAGTPPACGLKGRAAAVARIAGTVGNPLIDADLTVAAGSFRDEPFDRVTARGRWTSRTLEVASGEIAAGAKQIRVSGTFDHQPGDLEAGRLRFHVSTNAMPVAQIQTLSRERPGATGTVQVTAAGAAELVRTPAGGPDLRIQDLQADVSGRGLQLTGQALGNARLTAATQNRVLHARLESDFAGSTIRGEGNWSLEGDYPGAATISFSRIDLDQLRAWIAPAKDSGLPFSGAAEGELRINGPARKPEALRAELRLPKLEITPAPGSGPAQPARFGLRNAAPVVATMANSVVTINSARFQGRSTDVTLTGKVLLKPAAALDLRVNGRIDAGVIQDFDRTISATGAITADATVRGSPDTPQINGRMAFQDVAVNVADFPNGISNAKGVITFSGDRANIQSFTGETGGGRFTLSGNAAYSGDQLIFRTHLRAEEVRVRYPEGVSTVANASLNLTGTSASSMLSGSITVLRTGFNPQSDFSSVLAKSAEPVRTPAARTGLLGGLNFDIQIDTAPDIQVQSSLTQDIQVEASLKLRGTVSNPALVGRVNVTQGQLLFFGTKYNINQGSIAFYNAVKIEPVFDIDLETKARGIDITLTVSGPLKDLKLTPRSDPPLQFNEIISLLATGRAPTSDPTLLAQQATTPQSWQQMGASALLGSAIATPVAGRLQRFFGVSKLRIDPTLPGVEYNPQARITLEQQITPEITFTYITNVTSSNPQIVSVEWDFSKQWSVVALREENGLFGLDFFFKRRFK